MEQRKLIKLGNSSFAIALPKNWVDKSGLKKGENVFLEENGNGEITIRSKFYNSQEEKVVDIDVSNKDISLIRKEIVSAYTNGNTAIILKGKKDKKELNELKDFLRVFLSFEITENSDDKIIAKDFFNMSEAKLGNFIKRMDHNIRDMFSIIRLAIEKGKLTKKESEEIENIDRDTTKFCFLISRLFFRGLGNPSVLSSLNENEHSLFRNWWLAYNLEHIGDQLKNISKILCSSEPDNSDAKLLSNIFTQIYGAYSDSIYSIEKKDKSIAIESATKSKSILNECDKLSQSKNISTAKLAIIFRELENKSYQNLKMVMYSGE